MIFTLIQFSFAAIDLASENQKLTQVISDPKSTADQIIQAQKDFAAAQKQWVDENNQSSTNQTETSDPANNDPNAKNAESGAADSKLFGALLISSIIFQ